MKKFCIFIFPIMLLIGIGICYFFGKTRKNNITKGIPKTYIQKTQPVNAFYKFPPHIVFKGSNGYRARRGTLGIVYYRPSGRVGSYLNTITIKFSHAMTTLARLRKGEDNDLGIIVTPKVKGRFQWKDTRTIILRSKHALQFATRYRVTVPKGIQSVDGRKLEKSFHFEFESNRPIVKKSNPYSGAHHITLQRNLFVEFSHPVNAQDVSRHIGLFYSRKYSPRSAKPLEIKTSREYRTKCIYIKPLSPLPKNSYIYIKVRYGWKSHLGELACNRNYVSYFRTYGPMIFKNMRCSYTQHKTALPGSSVHLNFSNRPAKNFRDYISITPTPKSLKYADAKNYYIYLPGSIFQKGITHHIRIKPGLKDIYGQSLSKGFEETLTMLDDNPFLSLSHYGGRVLLNSPENIKIYSKNVPCVKVRVYHVTKEKVFSKNVLIRSRYLVSDLYKKASDFKEIVLSPQKNIRHETYLNIKQFSSKGKGPIYFVFETDKLRFPYKSYHKFQLKSHYIFSDIGIIARLGSDNILFWVASMKTGQALAEADVVIRGSRGNIVWKGKTDENGIARAPGKRKFPDMGRVPLVFVAKGNDLNYLKLKSGNRDGWIYGYDYGKLPSYKRFRGYIYTERGVYQPGNRIKVSAIVRKEDAMSVCLLGVEKQYMRVQIYDSRGKVACKGRMQISSFDTASIDLKLPKNAPLGNYRIDASLPGHGTLSKHFQVREYGKNEFEVKIRSEKPYYLAGDKLKCMIHGKSLFGKPMANAKVSWSLSLQSTQLPKPFLSGYIIGDYSSAPYISSNVRINTYFDKQGKLEIILDPNRTHKGMTFKGKRGVCRLHAHVTGTNGQSVQASGSIIIYPTKYSMGIQLGRKVLEEGDMLPVSIVVLDPSGKIISDVPVQLHVIHTYREYQNSYWVTKSKVIKTIELVSGKKTIRQKVQLPKGGAYRIVAHLKENNKISVSTFAYATGDHPSKSSRFESLQVESDKHEYKPGEIAKFLITSPYLCSSGIISFERNDLIHYVPLRNIGPVCLVKFKITKQMIPNVDAYIMLLRGYQEDGKSGVPQIASVKHTVRVHRGQKKLQVELKTNAHTYTPKEEVELDITVKDYKNRPVASSLTVMVVDESVLSLTAFHTPNPLSYFIRERRSWMATQDYIGQHIRLLNNMNKNVEKTNKTVDKKHKKELMKENAENISKESIRKDFKSFKTLAFREQSEKRMSNIGVRKFFTATTYFHPHVQTDDQGRVKLRFRLPENLSFFRIMAVAVDKNDLFGSGSAIISVKK